MPTIDLKYDCDADAGKTRVMMRNYERHISEAGEQTARDLAKVGARTARALAPGPGDRPGHHDGARPLMSAALATARLVRWTGSKSFHLVIDAVNVMSQDSGAAPHEIWGNPWLRFPSADSDRIDGMMYRSMVNHPGNPAHNFMMGAFMAMDAAAEGLLAKNYS